MALKKRDEEELMLNDAFLNLSKVYSNIYDIILNMNYKELPNVIDNISIIRERVYSNIVSLKIRGRGSSNLIKHIIIYNEILNIIDMIDFLGIDIIKRPIPFRISNIFKDDAFKMFFNGIEDLISSIQYIFQEIEDEKMASILKNSAELHKINRNILIEIYKNEKDLDPATLEQLSYFFITSGNIISSIERIFVVLSKS